MRYSGFEYIEKLSEYYNIFNENFMEGYIKIIDGFSDYLLNNHHFNSEIEIEEEIERLDKYCSVDESESLNQTIDNVIDFYGKINPKYKSMAIMCLRDRKLTKGINVNSCSDNMFLSGNHVDGAIITHELYHSFIYSKEQTIVPSLIPDDKYSPIVGIVEEINPRLLEFLYYDYMFNKSGIKYNRDELIYAIIVLASDANKLADKLFISNEKLKILARGPKHEEAEKISNLLNFDLYLSEWNPKQEYSEFIYEITHNFGTIVSCYIYQKVLEDPNNIKMFLGIEKVEGIVGSESNALKFLENLGIICFKDGKISLDDETCDILLKSLIKTFEMCKKNEYKNNSLFTNNRTVISDENMMVVIEMFNNMNTGFKR